MIRTVLYILLCLPGFTSNTRAQTTANYIEVYAGHAQTLMHQYKVPASVILAVAIHESASGTSKIARYLNNHFGIKGSNSNTEIHSSYRDYPTVTASYEHFLEFLSSRPAFNVLFDQFDQYDYKSWVKGIQRGGYARSRTWASQVIGIVQKNNLFQYDERPDDYNEPAGPEPDQPGARKTTSAKTYTVKRGDNLHTIAKAGHSTAAAIMKKNDLKTPDIKPGQKLKL